MKITSEVNVKALWAFYLISTALEFSNKISRTIPESWNFRVWNQFYEKRYMYHNMNMSDSNQGGNFMPKEELAASGSGHLLLTDFDDDEKEDVEDSMVEFANQQGID